MATHDIADAQPPIVDLLGALRRRLLVVVVCALAVPAATLALSLAQHQQYSASASVDPHFDEKFFGSAFIVHFIEQTVGSRFGAVVGGDRPQQTATDLRLAASDAVASRAARDLGPSFTASRLRSEVSVESVAGSDLVKITATDRNARLAARIANAYGVGYIAYRQSAERLRALEAAKLADDRLGKLPPQARIRARGLYLQSLADFLRIAAAVQTGASELVERAVPPTSASSPRPLRNTAIGLLIGVALGIGFALIVDRLAASGRPPAARAHGVDELADALDRPILAVVPFPATDAGGWQAFLALHANIRHLYPGKLSGALLVTSLGRGDGRSTVAAGLAAALASRGSRVLLVETDPLEAAARVPGAPFDVVSPPAAEIEALLQRASYEYDLVVVDRASSPEAGEDAAVMRRVDAVVAVVRLGHTTPAAAERLGRLLEASGGDLLGVVATCGGERGAGDNSSYGGAKPGRPSWRDPDGAVA